MNVRIAGEHFFEQHPQLHLRQTPADTQVLAIAEGQMARSLSRDVEREGIVPLFFVAIPRHVPQCQFVPRLDCRSSQFVVFQRRPAHVDHGMHPANNFIDRLRNQGWIIQELLPFCRKLRQRKSAARDGVASRLVTRDHQQHKCRQVVGHAHGLTVHPCVYQHGDQIVTWIGLPVLIKLHRVTSKLHEGAHYMIARNTDIGVVSADDEIRPFKQLVAVFLRYVKQLSEHLDWQFGRDRGDEIKLVAPLKSIEDHFGPSSDAWQKIVQCIRSKSRRDHSSMVDVLGRIHCDHAAATLELR